MPFCATQKYGGQPINLGKRIGPTVDECFFSVGIVGSSMRCLRKIVCVCTLVCRHGGVIKNYVGRESIRKLDVCVLENGGYQ